MGVSAVLPGYPLICQMIATAAQTGQSVTSPEAICVTVSIFLLSFVFQRSTSCNRKLYFCVILVDEFAIPEESDVLESNDCCLSLLCCWDFEIFTRLACGGEDCKACKLEDCNGELGDCCLFPISPTTRIRGIHHYPWIVTCDSTLWITALRQDHLFQHMWNSNNSS